MFGKNSTRFWMSGVATLSFVTAVAAPLAAQCVPPPSGLVSWWPAEGDATDLTGGNDGTLNGATTFAGGEVGQAFKFGGSAADNVVLGPASNLQLQDFTIEGWISRASTLRVTLSTTSGNSADIFGYGRNGSAFGLFDDGRVFLSKNNVDEVHSTTFKIVDLNFHHVAVTKAGAGVTFYVDGAAETAPAYSAVFQYTTNARIGAAGGNGDLPDAFFLGVIDELSVYNRPLTSDEIQGIVAAGSAGKCQPGQ